jgi:glycine dehydrogenase subunit 2
MGIADMGRIGVDILHLNLHKTFSTPHGGGGPGAGPVCVKKHLAPFLPVPRIIQTADGQFALSEDFPESIGKLLTFHGHFGVLVRAFSYILSMGAEGLKKASQLAVLNANYLKARLKDTYHLAYDRPCMHECVFSDRFQQACHVTTLDIAKRLMDYGYHPPTIYFPLVVHGALMMEPTETESKEDLDQYIDALKNIAEEAKTCPDVLRAAPTRCKVRRLDETAAARKPCLAG